MKNTVLKSFVLLGIIALSGCKESKPERAIVGKTKKEVVSFSPKLTGRILKIYVEEGQTVKAGDTLAILDVPEVSAKIAQAKGATSAAKAQVQMAKNGATADQLRQLKAKQKGLQEQFQYAQKSFNRAKNMYHDSLLSPQNYDEYFAKYQGAKAQLDAVNAELHDVEAGTRFEKIEMAQGQENQAMGALQEANVAYSERYVIATNDMEIETIALNKGELATAGYPLFTGYIPATSYFRFTIPESKIAKYQKGMSVKMLVNYSNKEFSGKIVAIKQLAKYADITTAFPDYEPEEAIYEIKVVPENQNVAKDILVNSNVTLK
ncbi:HlyD family secretion protein [Kaistella jeonii]|uniref:ABC transporter permease n=1 Tax=Kaistella jeonii TaxID=266749 RepID=A0A0C1CVR5_9FLAO|nr:biotin/lipoyl-binding protein [Kaistella jeonii]KIA88431.1 ABC transporter permease [Kaistella jeonii]SFC16861.1 HlyD family secretion protein [Kaistella jeonii]VEI95395.1 putative efflux pump membrane fusion protein [Kaistella jeonii]